MIIIVEAHNAEKHADLLEQMFRQRAQIFHDRLGWDVIVKDGKERDRFDDENPVYIIYTDDAGRKVKGSLRLLPTTGPTLLADFFSDTVPDAAHLAAPTIWECTRFCLDEDIWQKDKEDILFASTVLLVALGDLAVLAGIESIIGNFDASALHLWRRIGCEVENSGLHGAVWTPGLSWPAPHFRGDCQQDQEKAERQIRLRRGAGVGGVRNPRRIAFRRKASPCSAYVAASTRYVPQRTKDVDGRNKSGHDA